MYNELHQNEALQQRIVEDRRSQFEREAQSARLVKELKHAKTDPEKQRLTALLALLVSAR